MKALLRVFLALSFAAFALTLIAQQGESPLPALPADIPKDATLWMLLVDKTPAGQDAIWTTPGGDIQEFFQFNDRGRGPKTYSTYRFGDRGVVSYEQTHGVDYMKNQINETFSIKDGSATWKNQAEDGHEPDANGRFFVGLDSGPTSTFQLAQALLKNGNRLPSVAGW
jgi:hypothetical protein